MMLEEVNKQITHLPVKTNSRHAKDKNYQNKLAMNKSLNSSPNYQIDLLAKSQG